MEERHIRSLENQIEKYRRLREGEGYETFVTSIANAILEFAGKTRMNGYIIRDECIMRAIHQDVIGIYSMMKADKVVLKERGRPMRNAVIPDEEPLLVIECKHHIIHDDDFTDNDYDQIETYMSAGKFPNGILLSEYKARFYGRSRTGRETRVFPVESKDSDDIIRDIKRIIEDVRSM